MWTPTRETCPVHRKDSEPLDRTVTRPSSSSDSGGGGPGTLTQVLVLADSRDDGNRGRTRAYQSRGQEQTSYSRRERAAPWTRPKNIKIAEPNDETSYRWCYRGGSVTVPLRGRLSRHVLPELVPNLISYTTTGVLW